MIRYNTKRYWGYSGDTKPVDAQIGDRFLELDTKREYFFGNYNSWNLIGASGGTVSGGVNPTYDYIPVNSGGTFADSFIRQSGTTIETFTGGTGNGLQVDVSTGSVKLGDYNNLDGNLGPIFEINNASNYLQQYAGGSYINMDGPTRTITFGDWDVGYNNTRLIVNDTSDKITLEANNGVGINTTSPTNALHISGVTDPLRIEGLVSGGTDTELLSIDSTGVVHKYPLSLISGGTGGGVTSITTSGTGLSANTTTGAVTIVNTKPDQTVTITGGTNIQITGTYPNFGITVTGTTSGSGAYLPLSGGTLTGGLIANSGLTANTISQTQYIDFLSGATIPSSVAGRVFFDTSTKSISYYPDATSGVVVRTGQQQYIRVHNATGVKLLKGKVVEIQSATGAIPNAALAIASHIGNHEVVGVVSQDIENGEEGFVTNSGIIRGLNLSAFTIGDILYCSSTVAGELVKGTLNFPFNARSNQVGYVTDNGATTGVVHVSIQNEDTNLTLTSLERNILEGNVISSGVYEYTGMTLGTGQTINVAPARGWIVRNTYEYATLPDVINFYYTGGTNIPLTNLNTADSTFILINSGATIYQQTTFPTPQQRRENVFLGKVVHPNRSTITTLNQTVDFDVSPMAALRDLWTPLKLINQGIIVSPHSTTLEIDTSAGTLWGNGIGWITNQQNPDSVYISGTSPTTFQYRTRLGPITGGTVAGLTGNTTLIVPGYYDLNGVVTAVGGGSNESTNQRVFLFPTGLVRIQLGQKTYGNLAAAVAGSQTEAFTEYSLNRENGILIGIISVNKNATDLSDTAQAVLNLVSKFGEIMGGTGGLSTTTLQQSYDNSTTPEILTNSSLGALSIKNGAGTLDNVTNLLEVIPSATTGVTAFIRADGLISGTTLSTPSFTANANGVTATTISATTYHGVNAVTGGTYSNGAITFGGSGNINTIISGLPQGTITAVTESNNVVTVSSNSSPTTFTIDAATGGTYSNGVITLQGSGSLSTITGLGGSGGGGQVYFLNFSNTQTPYKEFSPIATSASVQTTGTSISSGSTVTLLSFLTPSNYPNTNQLPAGIWSFYLHSHKTNIGDNFTIYVEVYKRTSGTGGTETLLFTTDAATVNGVSPTPQMSLSDVYYSGTPLNLTDRILVVIKGKNNGTSTSTLTLVTEGPQYYSYTTTSFGTGVPNYTTGGTYNQSTGVLTFTRTDGNTYTAGTFNYLTGSSQSGNVLTLTTNTGQTFTYTPTAITGGTYSNGAITFGGSGGISTSITGLPQGTITAVTESNNTVTVSSNSSPTTFTIDAATGGTYSNGTITLAGSGSITNITGLPQGTITAVTNSNNTVTVASNISSNNFTVVAVTGGTYSNGTITLAGSGSINTTITGIPTGSTGGMSWVNAVSPLTATTNTGYIITGVTTITLPSIAAIGSTIEIVGASSGLWQISQLPQHQIRFGSQTTTSGTTGVLSATTQGDCVKLICTTANNNYIVASAVGNLFFN